MKSLITAVVVFAAAAAAALAKLVNRYQKPRVEWRRSSEREFQRAKCWREN